MWLRFTSISTLFLDFFMLGLTEFGVNNSLKFDKVLLFGVLEVANIALLDKHRSDSTAIKFLGVSFLSAEDVKTFDLTYYLVS